MAKSVCIAYLLWLVGGFVGLHHFYLRRYKHCFIYWCIPGGYFGGGWFRDLWRIPEYVRDANNDPGYLQTLSDKMRKFPKPPTFSAVRWMGQLLLGNIFSVVIFLGTPNKEDFYDLDLNLLPKILAPAATAIGIWIVGNVGREKGSLLPPMVACYLSVPIRIYTAFNSNTITCICGIIAFNWLSKQWRRKVESPPPVLRTTLVLILCGGLYSSLWVSYVYYNMRVTTGDGDTIPVRDAMRNFLRSPAVQQFWKNCWKLVEHGREHGFWSTYQMAIDSFDPLGEKWALKALELEKGSSEEQIKQRYRELAKKWHPDKFTTPDEKESAQTQFVEIQQAYEKLSSIKKGRSARNKRAPKAEE